MVVTSILWQNKSVSQRDATNSKSVSGTHKKGLEQKAICVEYEQETKCPLYYCKVGLNEGSEVVEP
jgi:hypothetical protein